MQRVAVLDVGKTNVKLSLADADGAILDTVSAANRTLPGPPYLHFDAAAIEEWFLAALAAYARREPVGAVVAATHGSLGALVGGGRLLMPMIDYDEEPPAGFEAAYRAALDPLPERGSPVLPGMAHAARQLLYLQTFWPEALARAEHYLGGPQYWAWRLAGVAAGELTYLGAQSHLWDIRRRGFLPIVDRSGWRRLFPPLRPAWARLGPIRPELARRFGLPQGIAVLCGIHDSSANFYRYQAAGLTDVALASTGTWIVGMADVAAPESFAPAGEVLATADVDGRPLAGILVMGGREYAAIAGDGEAKAEWAEVARLIEAGTMALPSFVEHDSLFPGSAGRGRIDGPPPASSAERRALALLYVALLTDAALNAMGENADTVLDGSFVRDPLYPALVAMLRPGRRTLFNTDASGTASGAALLAGHGTRTGPAPVRLAAPDTVPLPALPAYAARWRRAAGLAATE